MGEPEIALVFSADAWVELLHRHCSDHGGARVRQLLVDPSLAFDEEYSTLVTGHRWPALSPAFVAELHRQGRAVLGVWDRAEPHSERWLRDAGVDATVASDATPHEMVEVIAALPRRGRAEPATSAVSAPRGGRRIVVGGPAGTGSTEVAIALGSAFHDRRYRPVLVDADDRSPALANRLALPLEPNLRTAVDAVEYRTGELRDAICEFDGVAIVVGAPAPVGWNRLRSAEVLRLVATLARDYDPVLVDVADPSTRDSTPAAPVDDLVDAMVRDADSLVAVVAPTPVGVTRFVAWLDRVRPLAPAADLHVVVNRAPSAGFRRAELESELRGWVGAASVTFVPTDRRVEDAAWSGGVASRGRFARGIGVVTAHLLDAGREETAVAEPTGGRG